MDVSGFYVDGILNVTPREAYKLSCQSRAIIIDVREPEMLEYKQFSVPEIKYVRLKEIINNTLVLPRERLLIFADATGLRSKQAVAHLKSQGYENIANLAGGMLEWDRDGLPMVVNDKERVTEKTMFDIKKKKSE